MSTLIQISSSGSSGGRFGIADSSGTYTYYTSLTAAMTAAVSGQTIEMFADITETGSVEITLKDGVNINGNGHTYTLDNSGNIQAFKVANSTSIECSILNLNVIRKGSTGTQSANNALWTGTSTSGSIYLTGSTFTNLGSGCAIGIGASSTISVYNGTGIANTFYGSLYIESSLAASFISCTGISNTGTGINSYVGGNLINCTGRSNSGVGIAGTNGNVIDCTGISVSSVGLEVGVYASNSTGFSVSGNGINLGSGKAYGCRGISVSGRGISNVLGTMYNCIGVSSSNVGVLLQLAGATMYDSIVQSQSSYTVWGWAGSAIYNSTIICNWNNAGGNGIQGVGGSITPTIINCLFKLSNASAPYLNNGGTAQAISMRGNTYQGGAAFNPNLTQAIVATEDNQGNIFL